MNNIESLCRLTEVVETAGTDIAPTYAEYVQLAFAIATDCGEAGRNFFHRLCRLSAKYQHTLRHSISSVRKGRGRTLMGTSNKQSNGYSRYSKFTPSKSHTRARI